MKIIGFGKISLGVGLTLLISAVLMLSIDSYKHPYIAAYFHSVYCIAITMGFYQSAGMLLSLKEDKKWMNKFELRSTHYLRQLEAIVQYHKKLEAILSDPKINYDVNLLRDNLIKAANDWHNAAEWNLTIHELEKPDEDKIRN